MPGGRGQRRLMARPLRVRRAASLKRCCTPLSSGQERGCSISPAAPASLRVQPGAGARYLWARFLRREAPLRCDCRARRSSGGQNAALRRRPTHSRDSVANPGCGGLVRGRSSPGKRRVALCGRRRSDRGVSPRNRADWGVDRGPTGCRAPSDQGGRRTGPRRFPAPGRLHCAARRSSRLARAALTVSDGTPPQARDAESRRTDRSASQARGESAEAGEEVQRRTAVASAGKDLLDKNAFGGGTRLQKRAGREGDRNPGYQYPNGAALYDGNLARA